MESGSRRGYAAVAANSLYATTCINDWTGHTMDSADIADSMKDAKELEVDKWVAIFIAALAVMLSICSVGGDNATKDATRTNIQASDTWAFYQAKAIRQTTYKMSAEGLELRLATEPALTEAARKQIEEKLAVYKAEMERMDSDPKKGEGKKELIAKARELEKERDVALTRDPYFDYAGAFLQIAIVLASSFIVLNNRLLIMGSMGLGILGTLLMLNGFTLVVRLPFMG
jgi:hypothetical protein